MNHRLLRGTVIATAALLIFVGLGQPAQAGSGYPPCGPVCDNQNPAGADKIVPSPYKNCSADATTVSWVDYGAHHAELRYSPLCETTWVRKTTLPNGSTLPFDIRHISRYPNWSVRVEARNRFVPQTNWTKMLNDSGLYNSVCLDIYANENDYASGIRLWSGCSASY